MINPERPLVIYDHMRISLDRLDIDSVDLKLTENVFRLYGKRGDVAVNFNLVSNGETVGRGQKKLVLSGLREFEQDKIDGLIQFYNERKQTYLEAHQ